MLIGREDEDEDEVEDEIEDEDNKENGYDQCFLDCVARVFGIRHPQVSLFRKSLQSPSSLPRILNLRK